MRHQVYRELSKLASMRADLLFLQETDCKGDFLDRTIRAVDQIQSRNVAGVFFCPLELPREKAHYNQLIVEEMRSTGLAVVLLGRDICTFPRRSNLSLVAFDNHQAGYLLTDHLVRHGCRRIVLLGIHPGCGISSERLHGYANALEDHGLTFERALVRELKNPELDLTSFRSIMKDLKPDAVICQTQRVAVLAGQHLKAVGFRAGCDPMLAAFTDQPMTSCAPFPLTTVRFPVKRFARICYERLLVQIRHSSDQDMGLTLVNVELAAHPASAWQTSKLHA